VHSAQPAWCLSTGPEGEFSSPTGVAKSLRQGARVTRSWMQEEVAMATGMVRRFRWMAGRVRALGEAGMTTAEYAVGTVAAVAFAGLLLAVVRSGPVKSALSGIIVGALGSGS
jgi:Protein of unknown function (DUF4244)